MKKTTLLCALSLLLMEAQAQVTFNYPQTRYTTYEHVTEPIPATDEYLSVSNMYDSKNMSNAMEVTRYDMTNGNVIWKKSYAPYKFAETLRCMDIVRNDKTGEYAMVGYYLDGGTKEHKIFVLSIDDQGTIINTGVVEKLDTKQPNYYAMKIAVADDGYSYVIGGFVQADNYLDKYYLTDREGFVIKIKNSLQTVVWQTYTSSDVFPVDFDMDAVTDIQPYKLDNREFYVVGGSYNNNPAGQGSVLRQGALLLQLDVDGKKMWESSYDYSNNYHSVVRILCDVDSKKIFVVSNASMAHSFFVSAFDLAGNHILSRTFRNGGSLGFSANISALDAKFSCNNASIVISGYLHHYFVAPPVPIADGGTFSGSVADLPFTFIVDQRTLSRYDFHYNPRLLSDVHLFQPENSSILAYANSGQQSYFYHPETIVRDLKDPQQLTFPFFSDEFVKDEEKLNFIHARTPQCTKLIMDECDPAGLLDTVTVPHDPDSVMVEYFKDREMGKSEFDVKQFDIPVQQVICKPASRSVAMGLADTEQDAAGLLIFDKGEHFVIENTVSANGKMDVSVVNTLGQVVLSRKDVTAPFSLDKSAIEQNGIYYVCVRSGDNQQVKKVVIAK